MDRKTGADGAVGREGHPTRGLDVAPDPVVIFELMQRRGEGPVRDIQQIRLESGKTMRRAGQSEDGNSPGFSDELVQRGIRDQSVDRVGYSGGVKTGGRQAKLGPHGMAMAGVALKQPELDKVVEAGGEGRAAGAGGGEQRGLPTRNTCVHQGKNVQRPCARGKLDK